MCVYVKHVAVKVCVLQSLLEVLFGRQTNVGVAQKIPFEQKLEVVIIVGMFVMLWVCAMES